MIAIFFFVFSFARQTVLEVFERTMIASTTSVTSSRYIPLKSLVVCLIFCLTTTSVRSFIATTSTVSEFNNKRQFGVVKSKPTSSRTVNIMSSPSSTNTPTGIPFCDLPGDPSLILTTNVDLGGAKVDVMKALSKAVAKHTGKPESYVAVSITDNTSMLFGGTDAPLALGCLYSIGSITKESNGAITSAVTDALESYGVTADRIYINCFDVPRANVGWNRSTFAG